MDSVPTQPSNERQNGPFLKSRRAWRLAVAALLCAALWNANFSAVAQGENATFSVQPQTDQAVQRGLEYFRQRLRTNQPLGDGAYRENPAVTALAGMAFLASGSTPQEGPDAACVLRCVETLLDQTRINGVIAPESLTGQALMYSHGFGTTFLAECLGMSGRALDDRIRQTLEKAVRVIQQAQAPCGGWRYTLAPDEEDVSVTACMLVALRACRNAGLDVPVETVTKAVQYLQQCQNPDGGFRYRLAPGQSAFPRSAAVVTAMFTGGVYEGPSLENALKYLTANQARLSPDDGYYPYAMYYAIQALWLCDRKEPAFSWQAFYAHVEQELVRQQKPNGSWSSSISTDYATAMALIVLQIPNNTLPVLQH